MLQRNYSKENTVKKTAFKKIHSQETTVNKIHNEKNSKENAILKILQ
jgi:hypothetical protein